MSAHEDDLQAAGDELRDRREVEELVRLQEHRASYKKPGMTLAESLGLSIPDNAPGGHPIGMPVTGGLVSTSERARRHQDLRDAGFYDLDAFGRADA